MNTKRNIEITDDIRTLMDNGCGNIVCSQCPLENGDSGSDRGSLCALIRNYTAMLTNMSNRVAGR